MKHLRSGYGVNSWKTGNDFYKACLRWYLSTPMTPEEVHTKGIAEVHRISTRMQQVNFNRYL